MAAGGGVEQLRIPHHAEHGRTADVHLAGTERRGSCKPPLKPARSTRRITVDERTRLRDAIGQRAKAPKRATPTPTPPPSPKGGRAGDDREDGSAANGLSDKSDGALADLMADFGDDAMPLIDECYAAAVERRPDLRGTLDTNFKLVGDPEVGGLVDGFEVEASSEINDADMIECVRETIFSTVFPAPAEAGEAGIRLTMWFEPDER